MNGKMLLSDTLEEVTKDRTLEDVFFDLYRKEAEE